MVDAFRLDHIECLKYAHQNGCQLIDCKSNDYDCNEYIQNNKIKN